MVKYKINLKFKDTSIFLNEIITKLLKIRLQKQLNINCNYKNYELPLELTHYYQVEGNRS